MEVRNQKGNEYTPKSLYYLACGLFRHLRDIEIFGMNFLDHNDDIFARTRKVLDARMKSLVAQGIGTTTRQADPILPEQEDILWEKEVLGSSSAKSVQNTVFFYACKVFGLLGCDEHRELIVISIHPLLISRSAHGLCIFYGINDFSSIYNV